MEKGIMNYLFGFGCLLNFFFIICIYFVELYNFLQFPYYLNCLRLKFNYRKNLFVNVLLNLFCGFWGILLKCLSVSFLKHYFYSIFHL